MKKLLIIALAFALALTAFAGCASPPEGKPSELSPEEQSALYAEAIENAQDEDSGFSVMTPKDEIPELMYTFLGFEAEDTEALALSVSLVNIKAYGIVIVKPAEGRGDAVSAGLQTFIDNQKQSFDHYLPDQYAIAESARLETLKNGSLLMVMTPDVDTVYESISADLGNK
ncbi:MAG: DUF4358 domain-containing protein [Clostridiales bacterium]|nr:DUF4358 domain-containing protein [Clostridiales bacterium]